MYKNYELKSLNCEAHCFLSNVVDKIVSTKFLGTFHSNKQPIITFSHSSKLWTSKFGQVTQNVLRMQGVGPNNIVCCFFFFRLLFGHP